MDKWINHNLNLHLPSAQVVQRNAAYVLKVPAGHTAHMGVCGVVIDMEYIPAAHPTSAGVGCVLGCIDDCIEERDVGR